MEVSYRSPYAMDDDDLTEDEEYSDDEEIVRGDNGERGREEGEFGDEEHDFRIDDDEDEEGVFAERNGGGGAGQDQVDGESSMYFDASKFGNFKLILVDLSSTMLCSYIL